MTVKKNRVLKKEWAEFFHDFNSRNRFKTCSVFQGDDEVEDELTIAGILYNEEERYVALVASNDEPDLPCRVVFSVHVPRGVFDIIDLENDRECGVQIQGAPGTKMMRVEISGENGERGRHIWISSLAQKIYEMRGDAEGSAQGDWLKAESIVEKSVADLQECSR